jgi:hypothetical protein
VNGYSGAFLESSGGSSWDRTLTAGRGILVLWLWGVVAGIIVSPLAYSIKKRKFDQSIGTTR